ncbi:hypothetical protein AQUCO_03600086v1 [Aquilegia coerulea]|nr:hypothetical protein AQUCO_03600086v1 [Aquilegia coerulea]
MQTLHVSALDEYSFCAFSLKQNNRFILHLKPSLIYVLQNNLSKNSKLEKFLPPVHPLVSNHRINFYSKCQRPYHSRQIFHEIPFKSSGFLELNYIHICPKWWDVGQSLHSLSMKIGLNWDVFVRSSIVNMYAKCGIIYNATKMFDEMPDKNVVSWSGLIYALMEDFKVNDFTFSSVVRAICGNSTLLELGKQIHGLCYKTSFDSSSFVGSSLISLYSKYGVIEGAYMIFDELRVRILGAWNSMLIACATWACAECFRIFQKGQSYFKLMKDYGIEPGSQHYPCLVDLLARAGKLEEALSVIKEMPIQQTKFVCGSLLTGVVSMETQKW